MAFETGLITYLNAQTALTNLVSTRIYCQTAPQGVARPFLTYQLVDSYTEHHMTAASAVRRATYQFDCYDDGDSVAALKALEDVVRQKLDGYRGAMGSETVQMCHLVSVRDLPVGAQDAEEQGLKRVSMDFDIWYVEDVPSFS